ncbi:hypothetical protein JTB14_002844 [Gonioctena quinquepunctata]|nr:hypothetical protein JTB14_002844 [Gonioctena quinquepunctata]
MNRSWSNTSSNSSPGFVYFNQSPRQNPGETSDFISFNGSPSPKLNHNFSPSNYGSPKYHSSPQKFNLRNSYRYSGGNHGSRSPYSSPNNSYNSNFNNSRSKHRKHKNRGSFNNMSNNRTLMSSDGKRDMSNYYDHTSTLDPWRELEQELKITRAEEAKVALENSNKNNDTMVTSDENEEDEGSSSMEVSESEESSSSVTEEGPK